MLTYEYTGSCMCAGAHVWVCPGRCCVLFLSRHQPCFFEMGSLTRTWCLTKARLPGQRAGDPVLSNSLVLGSRLAFYGPADQTQVYRLNDN